MPKDKQGILDDIFPELAESEDERIRNNLIDYFSNCKALQFSEQEIVAWLEKQGEQKPIRPVWKYKKDHTPLLRDSFILNKYGCVAKSPSGALVSDVWVLDFGELAKLPKEEFERQGEQKPAWSEEDERIFVSIIEDVMPCGECPDYPTDEEREYFYEGNRKVDWLKSLKERIQSQPKWSEEDEERYVSCLLKLGTGNLKQPETINTVWLKSLKERVQLV